MASKTCSECGATKPLADYQKCASRPDGVQVYCRACRTAAAVEYRARTREHRLAYNKAYYAEHREEKAAYYLSRQDELKAAMRARHARQDPDAERAKRRAWLDANPQRHNELTQAYRDRLVSATVESVDRLVVLEMHNGVCGVCGQDVDPLAYEVDHIIPLSRGGEHSYANVQVAHPICNRRKHAMLPDEYAAVA